jgi:hypothetical protein
MDQMAHCDMGGNVQQTKFDEFLQNSAENKNIFSYIDTFNFYGTSTKAGNRPAGVGIYKGRRIWNSTTT